MAFVKEEFSDIFYFYVMYVVDCDSSYLFHYQFSHTSVAVSCVHITCI